MLTKKIQHSQEEGGKKRKKKKLSKQTPCFLWISNTFCLFHFQKQLKEFLLRLSVKRSSAFLPFLKYLIAKVIYYRLRLIWALQEPPEMVCWTSISYRHSTKHPSPALSRKEYPILSKHWQIAYTDTGARLQRGKNVPVKTEWHFSHQPDCSAFLHYHMKSAAGFLLENKLHWVRTMPEVFWGRDIGAFFFL